MTTTSLSTGARTGVPVSQRRRTARALAVFGAASSAAAAWIAAVPIAGVDLAVDMGGRTESVGLMSVVGVSLLAGVLGWMLLAVLETRFRGAAVIWTAVSLTVAVLSLAGPITSAASASAAAVLAGMHLLVAAVLVPALRRTSVAK